MKKIALHWKIIIGMILGILFGLIASKMEWVQFTNEWIKPWGKIFINLLKLIAVPLVFASLIKGISSLSDISRLSRIGGRTILIYLTSTVIAVTLGLLLVNIVQPGSNFDKDSIEMTSTTQDGASKKIDQAASVKGDGPLKFLVDIVPDNIFNAASNNRNMLQVIFFAILFGIAMVSLPSERVS